jgi:predicted acetyltransferase
MDELVYDSPDTLWAILGFCASFATDYPFVRFRAPAAHPLERLCADQALGGFERVLEPCGMLRVVHLENALRAARYRGDGEVTLRVLDRALGRDRALTVRYRDGRCEDLDAAPNRAADAEMEIGDFSAALLGRFEPEDFQYIPTIKVFHVEHLRGIFYRKPLCIADFF